MYSTKCLGRQDTIWRLQDSTKRLEEATMKLQEESKPIQRKPLVTRAHWLHKLMMSSTDHLITFALLGSAHQELVHI